MPQRYVLDASAGVEILNRTPAGLALAAQTFRQGAEEWTMASNGGAPDYDAGGARFVYTAAAHDRD